MQSGKKIKKLQILNQFTLQYRFLRGKLIAECPESVWGFSGSPYICVNARFHAEWDSTHKKIKIIADLPSFVFLACALEAALQ